MNGKPCIFLFFLLFRFLYTSASHTRGRKPLCLNLILPGFEHLLELPPFEDQFFLVTPASPKAHVIICNVVNGEDGRCVNLFLKYWTNDHFLLGNNFFAYSEKDLSEEARYHRGWLTKFINNLGYLEGYTLVMKVDKKRLKILIDIPLLIRLCSLEERITIFGKLQIYFLSFMGFLPWLFMMYVLCSLLCRIHEQWRTILAYKAGSMVDRKCWCRELAGFSNCP